MDWQTNDEQMDDQARVALLESLLQRYGELDRHLATEVAKHDAKIARENQRFDQRMKSTRDEMRSILDRVTQLHVLLVVAGSLKGRTFTSKFGKVFLRTTKPTLVVHDSAKALKIARRIGKLREVSVLKPRELSKTMMMSFLQRHPEFIARFKGAVEIVTTTRVTLVPETTKKSHYGELDGHQRRIVEIASSTPDA